MERKVSLHKKHKKAQKDAKDSQKQLGEILHQLVKHDEKMRADQKFRLKVNHAFKQRRQNNRKGFSAVFRMNGDGQLLLTVSPIRLLSAPVKLYIRVSSKKTCA